MISSFDFAVIAPELVLVGGAMLLLLLDAFWPAFVRSLGAVLAAIVIFAALLALQQGTGTDRMAFGALVNDSFSVFIAFLVLISAFLSAMLSWGYLESRGLSVGEFMTGLLIASAGMILMARSSNLMVIFVALEVVSISLYLLIAYHRTSGDSSEAGMKYFLLGAYASAIFLFGAALIYGQYGTMTITARQMAAVQTRMGLIGVGLLIVGMGFKISIVPFHLWTPDVYQGAPAPVTAFLSSASKVAAFGALMRIVYPALQGNLPAWQHIWPFLAAITMIVGNLIALVQEDVKRILAYSSIAHVGFILMALGGGTGMDVIGAEGVLFYLLTYVLATIGSFGVIAALPGDERGRVDLHYIRGLSRSHPWLAALMALFVLSLAGAPPLVGFTGKLYAFRAVIDAKMYWLAAFAALNAAMAVYYYLRIVVRMYMESRAEPHRFVVPQMIYSSLIVAAIGVVLLGLFPGPAQDMVRSSAAAIVPPPLPVEPGF